MSKKELLKPRLLECVDRLRKLIELDAPAVIIGSAALNVYTTTLATYGEIAASTLVQRLRDHNLHTRGVCGHGDCTEYVQRPDVGLCQKHLKELELEDWEETTP